MSKENKEEIFTFNLSLNDKNATDITVEIINLEDGIGYIGDKNTKKVYIVDYPKFEKLTLLQIKKLLNSFSDDYWLKNPYYDYSEICKVFAKVRCEFTEEDSYFTSFESDLKIRDWLHHNNKINKSLITEPKSILIRGHFYNILSLWDGGGIVSKENKLYLVKSEYIENISEEELIYPTPEIKNVYWSNEVFGEIVSLFKLEDILRIPQKYIETVGNLVINFLTNEKM